MPTGVQRRRTKNLAEREIAEWNRQRTETQKQLAEKYRLENAVKRGEYLNRAELKKAFVQLADALGQVVKNSALDRRSKEDFLRNLASWPLLLQEAADARSRLVNGKDSQPEV
jgi:hypothetical protein